MRIAHNYKSIKYVAETWTECGIISSCPTSQLWFEGRVSFFLLQNRNSFLGNAEQFQKYKKIAALPLQGQHLDRNDGLQSELNPLSHRIG